MKSQIFITNKSRFIHLIKGKKTNLIISVFMVGLVGFILGYLVYSQREVLVSYNWKFEAVPFFAGLGMDGIALLLGAWVWAEVMNTLGTPLPFWQHFQLFTMNMVARRVPGTVWHVLYRAQAYTRFGFSARLTTLASGIELVVCIISGVITSIIFSIPILKGLEISMWFLGVVLFAGIFLLHPRFLTWVISKCTNEPVVVKPKHLMGWVFIYVALWIVGGVILFMVINVLYPMPISQMSYIIGCWVLVGTVTQAMLFLPSNFGFGEASLSLLLSQIMPAPLAVLVTVANRILLTFFEIVWTLVAFFLQKLRITPV